MLSIGYVLSNISNISNIYESPIKFNLIYPIDVYEYKQSFRKLGLHVVQGCLEFNSVWYFCDGEPCQIKIIIE